MSYIIDISNTAYTIMEIHYFIAITFNISYSCCPMVIINIFIPPTIVKHKPIIEFNC